MDGCRNVWELSTDADERPSLCSRVPLRGLIDQSWAAAVVLPQPENNLTRIRLFRLFRIDPRIRSEGSIHKTIVLPFSTSAKVSPGNPSVENTWYLRPSLQWAPDCKNGGVRQILVSPHPVSSGAPGCAAKLKTRHVIVVSQLSFDITTVLCAFHLASARSPDYSCPTSPEHETANDIRIKRRASRNAGAPASLNAAELMRNEVNGTLCIGKDDDKDGHATGIVALAGTEAFADLSTTQTLGGAKTFSVVPNSSLDASGRTDILRKSRMDTLLARKTPFTSPALTVPPTAPSAVPPTRPRSPPQRSCGSSFQE